MCRWVARAPETVGGQRTGPGAGGSVWVPAMTAGSLPIPETRLWHPGPRLKKFTYVPSSPTTRPPRRPRRPQGSFWVRATCQVVLSCSRLTPGPSGGSSVAESSAGRPDLTRSHGNKMHSHGCACLSFLRLHRGPGAGVRGGGDGSSGSACPTLACRPAQCPGLSGACGEPSHPASNCREGSGRDHE